MMMRDQNQNYRNDYIFVGSRDNDKVFDVKANKMVSVKSKAYLEFAENFKAISVVSQEALEDKLSRIKN